MPYIKQIEREDFEKGLNDLRKVMRESCLEAGHLNYIITVVINEYAYNRGLDYSRINDVVGALESAKAEFQRRVVAPYEDKKIKENGDL